MTGFLIIGAGPAGLAAAAALAHAGAGPVTVVERSGHPGGVPRLCGHSPFGLREFRRILSGPAYAARLARAAEQAGARLLLHHAVTAIAPDLTVHLATPAGPVTLHPTRILLATGAREASRAERLLPGDRPLGVLTTGALQDLWFAGHALPFRRPVIYGSALVAMSAILTCRQAAAPPLTLIEPGPALLAPPPFRWLPRLLGLPVHTGSGLADLIATDGRLSQIVLTNGIRIACDGLVLTGDFRPETGLARMCGLQIDPATRGPVVDQSGRTSRPEIYAAGNILRSIETAGTCWAEGRAVAHAMLADLTKSPGPRHTISAGAGLSYVMPQRLTPGATPALPALQIRRDGAAPGKLILIRAGRATASHRVTAAPERRVTLPLPAATGDLILTFQEE